MSDSELPGEDLVAQGLRDLADGARTIPALLVAIAKRRLQYLGFDVPPVPWRSQLELDLYALLREQSPRDAYGRDNSLLRRLTSFTRALEARHGRKLRAQARANAQPS